MSKDRAAILVLLVVIAGLLLDGNIVGPLCAVLLLGCIIGALAGAAFVNDRKAQL
jgi:hypothetical protein